MKMKKAINPNGVVHFVTTPDISPLFTIAVYVEGFITLDV
jgi:hypothetical protein